MKYREEIVEHVTTVIREGFDKREAVDWIVRKAKQEIGDDDRARFIEIVEIELGSLHEGNIASYRLQQPEFISWKESWR